MTSHVNEEPIDVAAEIERELQELINESEDMLETLKHTLESDDTTLNELEQQWLDDFEATEATAETRENFKKTWKPLKPEEAAETTKRRRQYAARKVPAAGSPGSNDEQTDEARELNSAATRAPGKHQPGLTRPGARRTGATGDKADDCDSSDDDDSNDDRAKTPKPAAPSMATDDGVEDYVVAKSKSPVKRANVLDSDEEVISDKDAPSTSTAATQQRKPPEKRSRPDGVCRIV